MENDWASVAALIAFTLIVGVPFLGYVRAGMNQAEADWRLKMRGRFCVRCGYSLLGNVSGVCPECGQSIERDAPR
jgi:hypothetical protein